MTRDSSRSNLLLILLLGISLASVALVFARVVLSGQAAYLNLVWNLFLAWLPLLFARIAAWPGVHRAGFWLLGVLWLLFLPNSPYLVTDLVHLRPRPPVPLWFDILLLQAFVLAGLLLGFLSIHLFHRRVARARGEIAGWLFIGLILGLTGFGIYLGRIERWNSWDLFTRPVALIRNILELIRYPHDNKTAVLFSLQSGLFLFLAYAAFHAVTMLRGTAAPRLEGVVPRIAEENQSMKGRGSAF